MLSYMESGIVKYLQTKDLPEAVICPLNLGSKERQLRNSDLYTTYAVVVCGFSVAAAVFTLELLFTRTGWFVAAEFAVNEHHCGHNTVVQSEIADFGKPSKSVYPFSHRDNVNAASATRFAFEGQSDRGYVAADSTCYNTGGGGDDCSCHVNIAANVSPSLLLIDGKSWLPRFKY